MFTREGTAHSLLYQLHSWLTVLQTNTGNTTDTTHNPRQPLTTTQIDNTMLKSLIRLYLVVWFKQHIYPGPLSFLFLDVQWDPGALRVSGHGRTAKSRDSTMGMGPTDLPPLPLLSNRLPGQQSLSQFFSTGRSCISTSYSFPMHLLHTNVVTHTYSLVSAVHEGAGIRSLVFASNACITFSEHIQTKTYYYIDN